MPEYDRRSQEEWQKDDPYQMRTQKKASPGQENPQGAQTSQEEWGKSFHAATKAGTFKLNLSRKMDGTLDGTYLLQGQTPRDVSGEMLEDGDVFLRNDYGAELRGRFVGEDGQQLLFSNVEIEIPGSGINSNWARFGNVLMGEKPFESVSLWRPEPPLAHAVPQPALEVEPEQTQELESDAQLETWQRKNGGQQKTWRETGKLKGNPPVRSQTAPPNKNIVEDEKTYKQLLASVKALVKEQQARADTFKSKDGIVNDYKYWFMKVYSFVTENEIKYAEENTYYYPSAVLLDVLYFDKVYKDNLNAAADKQETHWQDAFKTAKQMQGLTQAGAPTNVAQVVLSLVSGMLAHIRFDLPRSLAWVAKDYNEKYGSNMDDLQPDFFSMAGVFDNATRDMVPVIINELGRMGYAMDATTVKVMQSGNWMNLAMREGLNADMSTERLDAWDRAEALYRDGLPKDPYELKNGKLEGNVTKADNDSSIRQMQPDWLRPDDAGIEPNLVGVVSRGLSGAARTGITDPLQDFTRGMQIALDINISDALIKVWKPEYRARVLLEFVKGSRRLHEAAQFACLRILRLADEDLTLVMDMVGAYDLLELMDGSLLNDVQILFGKKYYPETALNTIVSQIAKWLEKGTSERPKAEIRALYTSKPASEKKLIRSRVKEQSGFDLESLLKR